ncbi:hypothetical protein [Arcanobacterium ihumii]|uniref:hypothetical protein n=1 Tax=Arcanobacterium ihumii TaxID=2138162 RepID=UPI000F52C365|nr:hypothetical protein [Arcanobacterium ihumii]
MSISDKASSGSRPKRVVRLSRIDQKRLDRGEIQTPEEALHIYDAPPVRPEIPNRDGQRGSGKGSHSSAGQAINSLSPHERELLENLPPHFGKI